MIVISTVMLAVVVVVVLAAGGCSGIVNSSGGNINCNNNVSIFLSVIWQPHGHLWAIDGGCGFGWPHSPSVNHSAFSSLT